MCKPTALNIKEPMRVRKRGRNHVEAVAAPVDMSFLRVKKVSKKAVLPSRASLHSAGYDLSSAAEVKVPARGKAMVPTDPSIAIPDGTYALVGVQSGSLFNHFDTDFEVKEGDKVAQLIIEKIMTPKVTEVEDLDETVRGKG